MATLRVQFELDSDIYPELYNALCVVRSTQARNERVRQLAACGLVWENVRIFGAAAIGPTPTASDWGGTSVSAWQPDHGAAPAERESKSKRSGAASKPKPAAQSEVLMQPNASRADFVDLAISVTPHHELVSSEFDDNSSETEDTSSDAEHFARELPVLHDVVANESSSMAGTFTQTMPVFPTKSLALSLPIDLELQHSEPQIDAIQLVSLAQKPGMRSRLMRMKERGLFKNG